MMTSHSKEKPEPRICSVCGEPIEAFIDGDEWVYGAVILFGENADFYAHPECSRNSRLWNRVKAIEKKLDKIMKYCEEHGL